ncbi:MAG: hypothetical protein AAF391_01850 [Bacteroidota bacterium]
MTELILDLILFAVWVGAISAIHILHIKLVKEKERTRCIEIYATCTDCMNRMNESHCILTEDE